MPKPKPRKKTLPKDFADLLKEGDLAKLKAVFDACEPDARGGYSKHTALAFDACPDELARWLVEQGADLSATDTAGDTPLHARARSWRGNLQGLLDLGADVDAMSAASGTPLHAAASSAIGPNVRLLVEKGATVDALWKGMTPLEVALHQCSNSRLEQMVPLAECLLAAGAARTPKMEALVESLGKSFEFHRERYDPGSVEAASAALARLYALFGTAAVPQRDVHDGASSIGVDGDTWQQQHQALWDLLVPASAPAATVQGEVVRITGRIAHELDGNGGGNWDAHFRRMADALSVHLRQGNPLAATDLEEVDRLVDALKRKAGTPARMSELAVAWVARNPAPIKLDPPDYKR
jgi:hypothetical protein